MMSKDKRVSLRAFFQVQRTSVHFKFFIGLCTPPLVVYILALTLDNGPVIDPNAFLDNLSQLLGAATGIIFTISTVAIAISSDRYSSLIFSQYIKDKKSWFALLWITTVIIIATISIGLNEPMTRVNYWAMVLLFLYSVEALGYYVWHTLESLAPDSLAKALKAKGSDAIKNISCFPVEQQHDRTITPNQDLMETLATLASLAIKAVEQRDELLAAHFVKTIEELQTDWIGSTSEINNTNEFFAINAFKPPFCDEVERIFKQTGDSSENFKRQVLSIAIDLINGLCIQTNSGRRVSDTLRWYIQFFKLLVSQNEDGRYQLFYGICGITDSYKNNHLAMTANVFGKMLEIVTKEKDDDLWEAGMSFFTTARPSITSSLSKLRYSLQQLCQYVGRSDYPSWHAHTSFIANIQESRITSNTKRIFEFVLHHLIEALPGEYRENPYYTQFVKQDIHALEINEFLVDSVHELCLRLFSQGKHDELAKIWKFRGGNPDDIRWLPHNVRFVTIQHMHHSLPHTEPHIYQYYFLCLAYLLHQNVSADAFFSPLDGQIVNQVLLSEQDIADWLVQELRQRHLFLQNLSYRLDKMVDQEKNIIARRDETFDKLFDNQFLPAIQKAKNWRLEKLGSILESERSNIKNHFHRNVGIVQHYRQQFEDEYISLNKRVCPIEYTHYPLLNTSPEAKTKTVFSHRYCLSKITFTLLEETSECDVVDTTRRLIHTIYEDEYRFLISKINLHNRVIKNLTILNKAHFQNITNQLVNTYHTNYLILLLSYNDSLAIEQVIREKMLGDETNQIWMIQTLSRLIPVVVVRTQSLKNKAYLLQPTAIQWTVHFNPTIALTDCSNKETHVHLSANGVVACGASMPKGIVEIIYQAIEAVESPYPTHNFS